MYPKHVRASWGNRVKNDEVHRHVLSADNRPPNRDNLLHGLRWLGRVLHMSTHHLPVHAHIERIFQRRRSAAAV